MLHQLKHLQNLLILVSVFTFLVTGVAEANNDPVADPIPDQTLTANGSSTVDADNYFSDSDGETLTYTASSADTGIATVSVSGSTVTITGVAEGKTTVTVTASDPNGATVTQSIHVEVSKPNQAPGTVGTISDVTAKIDWSGSINVEQYFSDPETETLTFTASSSDTSVATVSVSGVTVTLTAVAVGTATITITAADPGGLTAEQTHSITVVVNQAPVVKHQIPDQTVGINTTTDIPASAYFREPDSETLTFTASSSATGVATVSVSESTVTITGVDGGTATITVTAADPDGLTVSQSFSVTAGNSAPTTVGTIPDQTLTLGGTGTVNLASYFSDPNGDTLTFTASSSNTDVVQVSMSNTTVTITGMSPGTATVTFTATDPGGLSATRSIAPTVSEYSTGFADVLPDITSEERARIAQSLSMDRVIFNELRNSSTDTHDWVELRNVSDADVNLDDWQLVLVTGESTLGVSFPPGASLAAGELLLLTNTDPNTPDMPLADTEDVSHYYVVDADLILPQDNFTLLLRSETGWEDSVGNYFFGREIPPTAPPLTADAAWYRVRPDALGYQSEAWGESGYQDGIGYDAGVSEAIALGTPGHLHSASSPTGDVNNDGIVNILDLLLVALHLGRSGETDFDLNSDGIVNIYDLLLVANAFGSVLAAPAADGKLSVAQLEQWLILAKSHPIHTSTSPRELSYELGIEVLEQMVRELIPQTTALLRNYPNPFNPETWIPYHLAKRVK